MEMRQIRYFLALCDERHFTHAAKLCGVAQPSLRKAIKKLEAELGGELFERRRAGIRLAALGSALHPHFVRITRVATAARRVSQFHKSL